MLLLLVYACLEHKISAHCKYGNFVVRITEPSNFQTKTDEIIPFQLKFLTNKHLTIMVILLVMFDLVYLIVWNAIHPLQDSIEAVLTEVGKVFVGILLQL